MKTLIVQKSSGEGSLVLPPSKSHTQRALLFALMANSTSTIHHYLPSPDTTAMLLAIESLGAKILEKDADTITILGCGGKLTPAKDIIDAKNSGQVLRFIGALAALLPTYSILTGDESIRYNRKVAPLLEGIRQLGGFADSMHLNNTAPILIKGPIYPGTISIDGACSQPISGFLMACSFLQGPSTIISRNAGEKPWIHLTLSWMDFLGLKYEHENFEKFTIYGKGSYDGFIRTIPGDMSSAAFPIGAALIAGQKLHLQNLDKKGIQGDEKVIDHLISLGASIKQCPLTDTLTVEKTDLLEGGSIDVNDCIDAVPILSALGCFGKSPLTLYNAKIARKKESDRLSAMAEELTKMGAKVVEKEDSLTVFPSSLKGTKVFSHKDHRVAMALAVAGLGSKGTTIIEDVECIEKSYPNFAKEFQKLGFLIDECSILSTSNKLA